MTALLRLLAIVLALVVTYAGVTFAQVALAAERDGQRPAEALVVLGAAQYDGTPSPVFAARLDHAAALYGDGLAPLVVVTGSSQPGDRFTEAATAAGYLAANGVSTDAIVWETTGRTTWESLAATARVLRERDMAEVVLVSDPFHAYRIADIATEVGLSATVSPTPSSAVTGGAHLRQLARETLAVGVGRVVGYRRLANLAAFVDESR